MVSWKLQGVPASHVTNALLEFPPLLDNWTKVFDLLKLNDADFFKRAQTGVTTGCWTYFDLFSKMISLWVTQSTDGASIQHLVDVFNTDFPGVSSALKRTFLSSEDESGPLFVIITPNSTRKLLAEKFSNNPKCICIVLAFVLGAVSLVIALSVYSISKIFKFHQNINTPIWQMQRSRLDFRNRESDQSILNFLNQPQDKSEFKVTIILGPMFVGKTELGYKTSYSLYKKENANCILIEGSNLKKAFFDFCASELGLSRNSSSTVIYNSLISNTFRTWLFMFDGVDSEESMEDLNQIFKLFGQFPPEVLNLMIIVTSRNDEVYFNALSNLQKHSKPYYHVLTDYGSIENILKEVLAKWVLDKVQSNVSKHKARLVGNYINTSFSRLNNFGKITELTLAASFSFFALVSQPKVKGVNTEIFLKFWSLALNNTIPDDMLFHVFNSLIDNTIVVANSSEQSFKFLGFDSDVKLIIMQYLAHPWISTTLRKLFGFETNQVGIIQWLIESVIKYLQLPCSKLLQSNKNADQIALNIFPEVFKYPDLIKRFKGRLPPINHPNSTCNVWILDTIELAYQKYSQELGKDDAYTLEIGTRLAYNYKRLHLFTKCGNLSESLYNIKKRMYGNEANQPIDDGLEAIKCLKRAGLDDRAWLVANDINSNCRLPSCLNHISFLKGNHTLSNALKRINVKVS